MKTHPFLATCCLFLIWIHLTAASFIGGGSSGGSSGSMQSAYNNSSPPEITVGESGYTLRDLSSETKSLIQYGDVNGVYWKKQWFSVSEGWQTRLSHPFDDISRLPVGKKFIIQNNDGTINRWTVSEAGILDVTNLTGQVGKKNAITSPVQAVRGSCSLAVDAGLSASHAIKPLITCSSAGSTNGFFFTFQMPRRWAGTTVELDLWAAHVGGTPSGTITLNCSGLAHGDAEKEEVLATTGQQATVLSFASQAQYRWRHSLSSAITLQVPSDGQAQVGKQVSAHCELTAATATLSDVRILGIVGIRGTEDAVTD